MISRNTSRGVIRAALSTQRRQFSANRSMQNFIGLAKLPAVKNEPVKQYEAGSAERASLLAKAAEYTAENSSYEPVDIPIVINGREIRTGNTVESTQPANKNHTLFRAHLADEKLVQEAIDGALAARDEWENLPFDQRAAVFMKAADLLTTKYRDTINATTMIGQSKTMFQAEIDAAAETADFWRFNAWYAGKLLANQQEHHADRTWNRLEYRALEGFVSAISPFNFTAIGSNLASCPAQMGNVVLWKPSREALLSNWTIFQILREAGLPDGVIQFLPCDPEVYSKVTFNSPHLSGLHFTGSTGTFNKLWSNIGQNIDLYKTYPRIVGETGGKNFHLLHASGEVENFVHQTLRGAFEYSGQKCSATSRAYVPKSLWPQVKELLLQEAPKLKVGQPNDPTSFTSSVISDKAFQKISGFIDRARQDSDCEIIHGGKYDDSVGYFIDPTIIVTKNPKSETMVEEIFGPVLTVFVYDDAEFDQMFELIDTTTQYGLTGGLFARDRNVIQNSLHKLRHSAGNVYINEKCTGAVVGNQPFGGARKSGTNDKAGSEYILSRWVSMRSIKEAFIGLDHWSYPSIDL